MKGQGMAENGYMISIIMPTFNSEKTLEESLKSIRRQEIDQAQIEILLVDGGSTDKTAEIARKYHRRLGVRK